MSNKKNKNNDKKNSEFVSVRVKDAKKRDHGRNIVRIEKEIMKKINAKTGDIIAIEGKSLSASIAWLAYPQDEGSGIIRIDALVQKNAGTNIDDIVRIRKVIAKPARSVVLAPFQQEIISNFRFDGFVKRKLNYHPITINDLVSFTIGTSREILLKVISLDPEDICIINLKTELHVIEEAIEGRGFMSMKKIFHNISVGDKYIKEDPKSAINYYNNALNLYEDKENGDLFCRIALSYLYLGLIEIGNKDQYIQKAENYFRKAQVYFQKQSNIIKLNLNELKTIKKEKAYNIERLNNFQIPNYLR